MNIDYKKTLVLQNTFNAALRQSGVEKDFYHDGKNLLASFQMSIFSDIKAYTANPGEILKMRSRTSIQKLKAYIVQAVLFFCSLTSFLALWIRYAVTQKPVVAVYSIDVMSDTVHKRDGRVSYMYTYMKEQNEPQLELMHTVPTLKSIKNFFNRSDWVIYIESVHFMADHVSFFNHTKTDKSGSLNFEDCSDSDKEFLKELYRKYNRRKDQFVISQGIYSRIFSVFKIKRFWSIDDTRYVPEILPQLLVRSTPTYMFQHGHYTKYHVGFLAGIFEAVEIIRPNYIVVWNEYFKQELIRLNSYMPADQILIGGEKKNVRAYVEKANLNGIEAVLIPYETDAPKDEVRVYVEKFLREGKTVYFKMRKDLPEKRQLQEYGLEPEKLGSKFVALFDESQIVSKVDMVAGVYSTYLYDMLYLGVPVVVLNTSMDYGEGMIVGGLAISYSVESSDQEVLGKYATVKTRVQELYSIISYIDSHIKNFA